MSPFLSSPVRDNTVTPMLPVSRIGLLKCNTELMAKYQSAKHVCEMGAALLGAQKGSRAQVRTGLGQASHKPSVHFVPRSHQNMNEQQTFLSISQKLYQKPITLN